MIPSEENTRATTPDNARIRAAMQAYAANPTQEQGAELIRTMMMEKFEVFVPMTVADEDGNSAFTTVVEGTPYPILHVYTSIDEIPEQEEDVELCLFLYTDLVLDLIQGEERWNGVIVDPDAAHSITQYFPTTGGHALYSTAALRKAAGHLDPGHN